MRKLTHVALIDLGLSSLLTGCVADTTDSDIEMMEGDDIADEDVAEAEQALGTCYGESCNGQDPGLTGCEADAVTRASSNIWAGGTVIGKIAIRHSPSCNATWARTSTTAGAYYLRADMTRSNPYSSVAAASFAPVTAQRSPMIGVMSGKSYTATGRIGTSYGFYPYVGNVSTTF
jgi:hypothetical protein